MRRIERTVNAVVLAALLRALRALMRRDSRVRWAMLAYPEGYSFRLAAGMDAQDPVLAFSRRGQTLARRAPEQAAELSICFKSAEDAFRVLTGQLGIGAAYAQHRFFLRGNPNEAMGLVGALELTEAYLFPGFWARRLMRRLPEKQCSALIIYGGLFSPGKE